RMITTEEDRDRAGMRELIATTAQSTRPALDFAIMVSLVRWTIVEVGEACDGEIAMVGHRKAEAFKQRQKTRCAQRGGPHQRAALGCPNVDGGTKHCDRSRRAISEHHEPLL